MAETTLIKADQFPEAVQNIEQGIGKELFDEQKFAETLGRSMVKFTQYVEANSFLGSDEKEELISRIDTKISAILKNILDTLRLSGTSYNLECFRGAQEEVRILEQEGNALIDELLMSAEANLKEHSEGWWGVTDEEFRSLISAIGVSSEKMKIIQMSSPQVIYDYFRSAANNTWDAAQLNQEGHPLYIKKLDSKKVRIFFDIPGNTMGFKDLPMESLLNEKEWSIAIREGQKEFRKKEQEEQKFRVNIQVAQEGKTEKIQKTEIDLEGISPVEYGAVESAYNMGIQGAFTIKMQLLMLKLYKKEGFTPPSDFKLDGGWGEKSQRTLEALFKKEKMDSQGKTPQEQFRELIALYQRTFQQDKVDLFLTPEEVNDPRYKFENKGVFRSFKMEPIKVQLMADDFAQEALQKLKGITLSQEIIDAYPRVILTLNRLTDDPQIKASIIATMVMEKGISTWADRVGMGRGDRKEYAYEIAKNFPKIAAIWNEYVPVKMKNASAGIMQINTLTAQEILRGSTGEYWPKASLVDQLRGNIEFSVVLAFMVYRDNVQQLRDIKSEYQSPES